jgi:hypothetical protein
VILLSYASGPVTSKQDGEFNGHTGGLVGRNRSGEIDRSYATGDVSGTGSVGGLVGYAEEQSNVQESAATGNVAGEESVGGLVGNINAFGRENTVTDSYATGNVSGSLAIGGILGFGAGAELTRVYATGSLTATDTTVGGLIGSGTQCALKNSYWDVDSTGADRSVGDNSLDDTTTEGDIAGLTTTELQGNNSKDSLSAFDFENIWATTDSYPALQILMIERDDSNPFDTNGEPGIQRDEVVDGIVAFNNDRTIGGQEVSRSDVVELIVAFNN